MKEKKGLKIAVITIVCVLTVGLGGFGFYLYQKVNSGLFFEETVINGFDAAGKSCSEVMEELVEAYSAPTLTITEGGETAVTLTLAQMGYTIDESRLLASLQSCLREQNLGLMFSLLDGNSFEVEIPFDFDETVFASAVTQANFASARVASVDAEMKYDGTEYYIEPEVYGTEFDDADLQVMVKDCVDKVVAESTPQEDFEVALPESFYYLPAVTQDDSEMNALMNLYNSYCKAKITLTFGEETQVLDWTTLQDWLIIDGGTATIDEDKVYSYVYELAVNYDTIYGERDFETSGGRTVHYDSCDYGYQIDQEAEAAQLIADIQANTETEREPVYSIKGYTRNGQDDICGNYVEVDLTNQHLWFYKDGELVIETDIVSGKPTEDRETATGVFTIPYKQTDQTLKGGSGSSAWSTHVDYWMPFHDGQGLHDAPWRTSFGGDIYKTNGSHGCVNLPADAAKTIYENMEERMPIFLYK